MASSFQLHVLALRWDELEHRYKMQDVWPRLAQADLGQAAFVFDDSDLRAYDWDHQEIWLNQAAIVRVARTRTDQLLRDNRSRFCGHPCRGAAVRRRVLPGIRRGRNPVPGHPCARGTHRVSPDSTLPRLWLDTPRAVPRGAMRGDRQSQAGGVARSGGAHSGYPAGQATTGPLVLTCLIATGRQMRRRSPATLPPPPGLHTK